MEGKDAVINMSTAELAAYIGAAAWLPQIVSWLWRRLAVPQVTIIAAPSFELGFTRLGPIFNTRLAFSAEWQDALVDRLDVKLQHEEGEEHRLRWAGMSEHLSEITDAAGNRQVVSREQDPIAFQIGQKGILEKFVRFQEPRFWEKLREPFELFGRLAAFLREQEGELVPKLLESKEFHELQAAHQSSFWWKPGRWTVVFEVRSPTKVSVKKHNEFELSEVNVKTLTGNIALVEDELQNIVGVTDPEYQPRPVNWQWVNVPSRRTSGDAG